MARTQNGSQHRGDGRRAALGHAAADEMHSARNCEDDDGPLTELENGSR
jgi:hypothetical protein